MLNWNDFKRRPNLEHLTESEKWRRFLLEKEEIQWQFGSAAAIPGGSGGGSRYVPTLPSTTNQYVQEWLEKIQADGLEYPSQPRVDIYTAAFDYAAAQGLLMHIDLLGLFKVENVNLATVPFIHSRGSSARFTLKNDPDFDRSKGLRGAFHDGNTTIGYVNTNWKASRDGVNAIAGNTSMGAYVADLTVANPTLMSSSFLTDPEGDFFYDNTLLAAGGSVQVAFQEQFDINFTQLTGATTNGQSANTSSEGVFSGTYASGLATVYKDGVALSASTAEVAPGNNTGDSTMLVLSDCQDEDVPNIPFESYVSMFWVGSGTLDQLKMTTFVNMLLKGTPIIRLANGTPTADATNTYFLYGNVNRIGNSSTDETPLFNIYGEWMNADSSITVTMPSNFEIFDGSTWRSGTFSISYSGTTLNNGAIYKIRMKAGMPVGTYQQNVTISGGGANPIPIFLMGEVLAASTNVAVWENQLTGTKPSGLLIKALNTCIDGIISDGDMAQADYFLLSAGMETNEQRLLPFKNTSGALPTLAGAAPPTGDVNGWAGTATGYINFHWKPATHGVMGSQNNFSIHAVCSPSVNKIFAGTEDAAAAGRIRLGFVTSAAGAINDATFANFAGVSSGASGVMYLAGYRTDGTTKFGFRGVQGTNTTLASNGFSNNEMYGLAFNNNGTVSSTSSNAHTGKMWMWGSSSISATRVRSRLNAYFTTLGLAAAV